MKVFKTGVHSNLLVPRVLDYDPDVVFLRELESSGNIGWRAHVDRVINVIAKAACTQVRGEGITALVLPVWCHDLGRIGEAN
jgi:hypothetical protein